MASYSSYYSSGPPKKGYGRKPWNRYSNSSSMVDSCSSAVSPSCSSVAVPHGSSYKTQTQVLRYFNSPDLHPDPVEIKPSSTTYQGMFEVLCLIAELNDPLKTFVLCPFYKLNIAKNKGHDTQAGGGGKPVKWLKSTGEYEYESPHNAVQAEMLEELRICGPKPHLVSESVSITVDKSSGLPKIGSDGAPVYVYTNIYSYILAYIYAY